MHSFYYLFAKHLAGGISIASTIIMAILLSALTNRDVYRDAEHEYFATKLFVWLIPITIVAAAVYSSM